MRRTDTKVQCAGGENFGEAVAKVTRTMTVKLKPMLSLFSQHSKVSNYDDEDFVHQDGHLYVPAFFYFAPFRLRNSRQASPTILQGHLIDMHLSFLLIGQYG